MNKKWAPILLSYSLFLPQATAATIADTNYWKCTAHDAEHKEWTGHSSYQLTSINRAYEACKRQSRVPESCQTSKESCEQIVDGMTTSPMWRCVALDESAAPWASNIYRNASDAAVAAKAYCQANSILPETCYVYLFTCRNLNVRNLY
ncbi:MULTISPECIES: hypothetical protein [unclassified Legionella]|uniref:hypothetical protein n=1 Tax=unclassified Legionella TaxID=2622702 RepID=UPI001055D47E|nr:MULTISPECIES: hypothetical protein [unclassified Legionella]MDI9818807.1 hypothetical protein [Legionella sp. PL877]